MSDHLELESERDLAQLIEDVLHAFARLIREELGDFGRSRAWTDYSDEEVRLLLHAACDRAYERLNAYLQDAAS
ncbi:MAG: hypothetical protein V3S03_08500 [Vicinamibacteria bacterium]